MSKNHIIPSFTAAVWGPYHNKKLNNLRKCNKRKPGGSWAISTITVVLMQYLSWLSLQLHCKIFWLQIIFKIINQDDLAHWYYFTAVETTSRFYCEKFTLFIHLCTPKQRQYGTGIIICTRTPYHTFRSFNNLNFLGLTFFLQQRCFWDRISNLFRVYM